MCADADPLPVHDSGIQGVVGCRWELSWRSLATATRKVSVPSAARHIAYSYRVSVGATFPSAASRVLLADERTVEPGMTQR
jgi:hypothetical protein